MCSYVLLYVAMCGKVWLSAGQGAPGELVCVVTDGANVVDGVVKEVRVKGVVAVVKHVSDDLGLVSRIMPHSVGRSLQPSSRCEKFA